LTEPDKKTNSIYAELTQPFVDLFRSSRAVFGLNLSYMIEGLVYFGIVGLLVLHFNENVGLNDIQASLMVSLFTAGITISQLLLGATVDWVGVRRALLYSLFIMLAGRIIISALPLSGAATGYGGPVHLGTMFGLFLVVIAYGIYQPAAYTAVKKFFKPENAAMGYAMLYGLMNLGGFLPGLISPPIRHAYGIVGVFWVFVALNIIAIIVVLVFIGKRSEAAALAHGGGEIDGDDDDPTAAMSGREKITYYLKNFPLTDLRFLYFIFILIPVQTLFAHNWLTLPPYTSRAFSGVVSEYFEFFVNLNPILIFVFTPIVTALTSKVSIYRMMILGTLVMALPTFFLTLGPSLPALMAYLIVMTIGEAMWQPRFLQWVAEIAPRGMTGIYMGIGQFPWFLTKMITGFYSGWFLTQYVPEGANPATMNSEFMWFIYALIAMLSPIGLIIARKWMMRDFKEKHEG
jgi:POT family proton-dependent oligopeptide transporter